MRSAAWPLWYYVALVSIVPVPANEHTGIANEYTGNEHTGTESDVEVHRRLLALMPGFLLAVVIIVLMIIQMGLVFLTNWRDALGRSYVYGAINTTVSIFCAVLINRAVFETILVWLFPCALDVLTVEQLGFDMSIFQPDGHHHYTGGHTGGHSGHHHTGGRNVSSFKELTRTELDRLNPCGKSSHDLEIAVSWLIWLFWFWALNVSMALLRNTQKNRLKHVLSEIGGHLIGFAGIESFGNWQYHFYNSKDLSAAIPGVAALVSFMVVRVFTGSLRWWRIERDLVLARGDHLEEMHLLTNGKETDKEDIEQWSETVKDAEDDANALCLGFLLAQLLCRFVIDRGLVVEEDATLIPEDDRNRFKKCYLYIGGAVILFVILRVTLEQAIVGHAPRTFRFINNLQKVLSMAFTWSLFKHGDWFWRQMFFDVLQADKWSCFNGSEAPPAILIIARAVNAVSLTSACTLLLVALVSVGSAFEGGETETSGWHFCKRHCAWSDKHSVADMYNELAAKVSTGGKKKAEARAENNSVAIQAIHQCTTVLGFLVGICWEKTFASANLVASQSYMGLIDMANMEKLAEEHHQVGPAMKWFGDHPVTFRVLLTIIIVVTVCTVWWKHLVRYAQFSTSQHLYILITQSFFRDCSFRDVTVDDVSTLRSLIEGTMGTEITLNECLKSSTLSDFQKQPEPQLDIKEPSPQAASFFPSLQCCSRSPQVRAQKVNS